MTPVIAETLQGEVLTRTSFRDGELATPHQVAEIVAPGALDGEEPLTANDLEAVAMLEGHPCLFEYRLTLGSGSDGGDGYVVKIGRDSEQYLTEDELRRPGALDLTAGAPG